MEDQSKPPFYEPQPNIDTGTNPDGTPAHPNFIADKNAAEDVAYVERSQGRDAALTREAELKRQHEDGLNDEERQNIQIMEKIAERYPEATMDVIGSDGKRVILLKNHDANTANIAMTPKGAFAIIGAGNFVNLHFETIIDVAPITEAAEAFIKDKSRSNFTYHEPNPGQSYPRQRISNIQGKFDLTNENDLRTISKILKNEQEFRLNNPDTPAKPPSLSTDQILERI